MGALAPGIPERAMAAEGGSHTNFVFGGQDHEFDEYFACYDIELSGWGGRPYADGNDATDSINGNCRVIPVEVFETPYPWFTECFSSIGSSWGRSISIGWKPTPCSINLHALLGGTGENRGQPGIIAKKAYTSGKNTFFCNLFTCECHKHDIYLT